jgi:hypothetical protein
MSTDALKDLIVSLAYAPLKACGVSHDRLDDLLGPRVRLQQWRRLARNTRNRDILIPHPDAPRILMLPMIGGMYLADFELCLALALQGRGANVEMIYCDGLRPRCAQLPKDVLARSDKDAVCTQCWANARKMLAAVGGLRARTLRDLISPERDAALHAQAESVPLEEIPACEVDGVAVGKAAWQTFCRHMRMGVIDLADIGEEDRAELRMFLHSALLTLEVARVLAAEGPVDTVMMSHGIYVSWAPALEYFMNREVYAVTYDRQARRHSWIFNADMPCRLADISEPFLQRWRDRGLTPDQRQQAVDYLASRETFAQDTLSLTFGSRVEQQEVRRRLGVRDDLPLLTMFTNNLWDAAAVGRDLVFENVLQWAAKTIRFVGEHPDKLQLVIKPHPAEKIRGTRQAVGDEIRRLFPELPGNVVLLEPDVDINSTSIMKATDLGIVHTSTVGMEMTIFGIPVVVVSWTHYRDLGFTFDPRDEADYFRMIGDPDALAKQLTQDRRDLALTYFYTRFFKYCLTIPLYREKQHLRAHGYLLDSFDDLMPGRLDDLDFVCDGILGHRSDFVKD